MTQAKHHYQRSICLLLTIGFILLLGGCSSSTSTQKAKLTGTITLSDTTDFSNVTIALYETTEVDSSIQRIQQLHPNIGYSVKKSDLFDHRTATPRFITTTSVSGSFELKDLPYGTYTFVAYKAGFGFTYIQSVPINQETVSINDIRQNITLYPETHLGATITTPLTLLANHHYIADNNVIVATNGGLTIQPGAVIRIATGKKIAIYGNLSIQGSATNTIQITSNDLLNSWHSSSASPSSIGQFGSFEINLGTVVAGNLLSSVNFSFAKTCISNMVSQLLVENCLFRYFETGIQLLQVPDVKIKQSTFMDQINQVSKSITTSTSDRLQVQENCFFQNDFNIYISESTGILIKNNFFNSTTSRDIQATYNTDGTIEHNNIERSQQAIYISGQSNMVVNYNHIVGVNGILNEHETNWYNATFSANYNNFFCTGYAVKTKEQYQGSTIHWLDVTLNHWGTMNLSDIATHIWDRTNEVSSDPFYNRYLAELTVEPIQYYKVSSAGIVEGN